MSSPQDLNLVQTQLGSQVLSCRENVTEQPCGGCLYIPWQGESPPWARGHRGHCHCKRPPSQHFPAMCDSQPAGIWGHYLPWRQERQPQECVFRPLSYSRCLAPQTSDFQACSKGLNSQVRAVCHPTLSEPCKHISRSAQYCPWGRRLQECINTTVGCHAGVT